MQSYIWKGAARRVADSALAVLMALVTPLLEKNPAKALATPGSAFVFSMSRLIVLAFATAMLRQLWQCGVGGWPEATLSMAIVLALPLLGALDRVSPEQVLALGGALIGRFGIGDVGPARWRFDGEPNRFDNHREYSLHRRTQPLRQPPINQDHLPCLSSFPAYASIDASIRVSFRNRSLLRAAA